MSAVTNASVEDQKRAIDNWAAHWSAHDMDRLLPLFTEDVVYEDVTMGVMNRGLAQLRAFGEGFFSGFPDITFELRSSFGNGSSGGAEWIMRGVHTGDLPGMSCSDAIACCSARWNIGSGGAWAGGTTWTPRRVAGTTCTCARPSASIPTAGRCSTSSRCLITGGASFSLRPKRAGR